MIIRADARRIPLKDEVVQMVCCSPPYWALRDYQTGRWEGGAADCDHKQTVARRDGGRSQVNGFQGSTQAGSDNGAIAYRELCGKCGARRIDRQIGLERSIADYIDTLVGVFEEVKRVLRPDGVCFVNIGDSYATKPAGNFGPNMPKPADGGAYRENKPDIDFRANGLKPKDLCLIPERLVLALQDSGWYVRSRIAWVKPAPMPESVEDRPTSAWEHVWLLTKSARYYYDAEAVREPNNDIKQNAQRIANGPKGQLDGGLLRNGRRYTERYANPNGRNLRNWWNIGPDPSSEAYCVACDLMYDRSPRPTTGTDFRHGAIYTNQHGIEDNVASRSDMVPRCVRCKGKLTVHYAAFPRKLVERCIKAGTPERGVCSVCLTPWVRIVENNPMVIRRSERTHERGRTRSSGTMLEPAFSQTLGWRPQCQCGAGLEPDDLEIIESPTGHRVGDDPSLIVGRAGYERPRADSEGRRAMLRWQQRDLARQIKKSPHIEEMRAEAGKAFEHYIRFDRSGARPVPMALLDKWIARGWCELRQPPRGMAAPTKPALVLDCFSGTGTSLLVAESLGRRAVGTELSWEYCKYSQRRTAQRGLFAALRGSNDDAR